MILFLAPFLKAEDEKPFVLVSPLVIEGLSADEGRFIENLIHSYINNLGEILTPREPPEEIGFTPERRIPDYTFSGSVTQNADSLILTLEIGETVRGDRVSVTSMYKTTGELVLNVRSVVESAFSGRTPSAVSAPAEDGTGTPRPPGESAAENITEAAILGTWRGEPGIMMLRLRRGGQGIAVFSSGAQMNLLYTIENNILKVAQNSPNTERYYQRQGSSSAPLPYLAARRLAGEAEPMRWELLLYENGTVLRGAKTVSNARYDLENVLEIIHGTIQEVEWLRTGR